MQKFLIFAGIGIEIGFLIYAAYMIGNYLDQTYQSNGMIFIGLSLAMLVAWLVQVIWLVNRFQKQEEAEESASKQ